MNVLQVLWDGGGNTAPQLGIARELVDRGHRVRILTDRCQRDLVAATGAEFAGYTRAPQGASADPQTDPIRDWEARTPLGAFARIRDRLMFGPAELYARDVLDVCEDERPDAIVWDYLLQGAGVAAESAGIPSAVAIHSIYPMPAPGAPPFGLGLMPAKGPAGRARDAVLAKAFALAFRPGLRPLNQARTALGLEPLENVFDQVARARRALVLTAPELDFAADGELPPNVLYTGPVVPRAGESQWDSPWDPADARPLVVASFSTTFMGQDRIAGRVVEALAGLEDVRGLVTTGPALRPESLPAAANVEVREFVPHAAVLPEAALMVAHGGMGTVHSALAAGVPIVCMPQGRDQGDVAARLVARRAGVRLRGGAGPGAIRDAVRAALGDEGLRAGAREMAEAFARQDGAARAADEIEQLAP